MYLDSSHTSAQRDPLVSSNQGTIGMMHEADVGTLPFSRDNRRSRSIQKPLAVGWAALIGLFGLLFVWAVTFNISGAVIGKGQVQASINRIAVQHPIGGVVAEILANNGDRVKSGSVLVRLEDSSLRSDLATVESELFEI